MPPYNPPKNTCKDCEHWFDAHQSGAAKYGRCRANGYKPKDIPFDIVLYPDTAEYNACAGFYARTQ